MASPRKPTSEEAAFLEFLIKKASVKFSADWKEGLLVKSMTEDEMGSLYLFPKGITSEDREFGDEVSEYIFKDEDRREVIATLTIDDRGNLFELDIWKSDFSALIKFPAVK
jgi:uncharacterized protein DUF6984